MAGSGYRTHFNGWQAINYVEADRLVGMPGHPDSDVDGDGLDTWDEYALGTDVNVPNEFSGEAGSTGAGATEKFGVLVTRRRFTSDVLWELLGDATVPPTTPVSSPGEADQMILSPTQESVLIHDPDPISGEAEQYYQVRISPIVLP